MYINIFLFLYTYKVISHWSGCGDISWIMAVHLDPDWTLFFERRIISSTCMAVFIITWNLSVNNVFYFQPKLDNGSQRQK